MGLSIDQLRSSQPVAFEPRLGPGARPALSRWAVRIATVGGVGFSPIAPGTAGSLVGVTLFLALVRTPGLAAGPLGAFRVSPVLVSLGLAGLALVLLGIGAWASGRAEVELGCGDDPRIVIDEVVGQLLALAPLPCLLGWLSGPLGSTGLTRGDVSEGAIATPLLFWVGVVTGFVLFRVFDIAKPGAVHWAERRFQGGFGVMADDVVAGIFGALALTTLAALRMAWTTGGAS